MMNDQTKTKTQLIAELTTLRQWVADLGRLTSDPKRDDELFHSMLEAIPTAIVVVDETGKIVLVNAQAESLFGYEPAVLNGQPLETLIPHDFRAQHPAYRADFMTNPTARPMGQGRDLYGLHKDGHQIPVEIGLSPIETEEGLFILSAVVDITERKRAEERLRLMIEAVPTAIIAMNEAGEIVLVNSQAESLFGYERQALIGQPVETLIPHDFRARHPAYRADFMTNPTARPMGQGRDLYGLHKDGHQIPVEIGLSPIETEEGLFILSAVVDITERKRAEAILAERAADLERSNTELEQFAYIASHDLQEPLRMVSSYLQLLERRYRDKLDASAQEFIDFAVDGAKRMKSLIDNLLTYARLDTQAKPLALIDSQTILIHTLTNLKIAIQESGAVITHDPLPTIMADESQLEMVFQNLISNALKFQGEEAPRIHIGAKCSQGQWLFSVADNGIGLDPKFAEQIFVIFQRLHAKSEYAGSGIGLAVCKRIIERHGGRIWVESQPGQGSTFLFTIPEGKEGDE